MNTTQMLRCGCIIFGMVAAARGDVLFVDADQPGGDGSTWAQAFNDLAPALALAQSGDEIWIAEGTYRPTAATNDEAFYQLVDGVDLYGGFDGTEAMLSERAGLFTSTILSGEIGGPGPDDNAFTVMMLPESAGWSVLIDGFLVEKAGEITQGTLSGGGYGVKHTAFSVGVALTVRNCTFKENAVSGLEARANVIGLSDCMFEQNGLANKFTAGALDLLATGGAASVVVADTACVQNFGRGAIISASESTIVNSSFSGNIVASPGGGLDISGTEIEISQSVFSGNGSGGKDIAAFGGGMRAIGSSVIVESCVFANNEVGLPIDQCGSFGTVNGFGGGAWISANSARVLNSLFDGNTAAPGAFTFDDPVDIPSCEWTAPMSSGGGLVVSGDDVMVDGCSFQNNIVFGNGGGASAHVDPAGTLSFVDCSFEGNIARYSSWYVVFFPNLPESGPQGGGLYLNSANDSAYLVDRCRFDNNLVGIAQDAMGAIDLSRGGAIRAELLDEQLTILNSQFCLNRGAQDSGLLTDVPTDVINWNS